MFEDSLMDSSGKITTNSRYYTLVGIFVNALVLAVMILVPLIYPEALPRQAMETLLVAPPPLQTTPPPPPKQAAASAKIVSEMVENSLIAPGTIPQHPRLIASEEPLAPMSLTGMGNSGSDAINAMTGILGHARIMPVVKQDVPLKKMSVSSGVMQGNLVNKTAPAYPVIAKAARISGTVVLQAIISKAGSIENLRVMSGPPLLQQAAIDAVRTWKYRPYLLNGEPVEVETQVNVVFNLGG